ncbi:hypothetical protein PR048_014791 [Dryococelus australis]|uniref:Uncharacterized protein n=1 Tax=Dryococelus australis TaxID=614101 RepID=A0ABQ9HFD5_9NEOP|nr:hypothetical protein PR048_014791 [Dryococelus australis]
MKRGKKWKIPEKTRRPAVSSGTIPMCEDPGSNPILWLVWLRLLPPVLIHKLCYAGLYTLSPDQAVTVPHYQGCREITGFISGSGRSGRVEDGVKNSARRRTKEKERRLIDVWPWHALINSAEGGEKRQTNKSRGEHSSRTLGRARRAKVNCSSLANTAREEMSSHDIGQESPWGRGGVAVRLLISHPDEPCLIPGEVVPDASTAPAIDCDTLKNEDFKPYLCKILVTKKNTMTTLGTLLYVIDTFNVLAPRPGTHTGGAAAASGRCWRSTSSRSEGRGRTSSNPGNELAEGMPARSVTGSGRGRLGEIRDPADCIHLHRSRIFACGNRAGRFRWPASFLGDLPFLLHFHSGAAPYSPRFTLIGSQDLDRCNQEAAKTHTAAAHGTKASPLILTHPHTSPDVLLHSTRCSALPHAIAEYFLPRDLVAVYCLARADGLGKGFGKWGRGAPPSPRPLSSLQVSEPLRLASSDPVVAPTRGPAGRTNSSAFVRRPMNYLPPPCPTSQRLIVDELLAEKQSGIGYAQLACALYPVSPSTSAWLWRQSRVVGRTGVARAAGRRLVLPPVAKDAKLVVPGVPDAPAARCLVNLAGGVEGGGVFVLPPRAHPVSRDHWLQAVMPSCHATGLAVRTPSTSITGGRLPVAVFASEVRVRKGRHCHAHQVRNRRYAQGLACCIVLSRGWTLNRADNFGAIIHRKALQITHFCQSLTEERRLGRQVVEVKFVRGNERGSWEISTSAARRPVSYVLVATVAVIMAAAVLPLFTTRDVVPTSRKAKPLTSHLGEPGSIPGGAAPGFSHVGIVAEMPMVGGSPRGSSVSLCSSLTSPHPYRLSRPLRRAVAIAADGDKAPHVSGPGRGRGGCADDRLTLEWKGRGEKRTLAVMHASVTRQSQVGGHNRGGASRVPEPWGNGIFVVLLSRWPVAPLTNTH